MIENREFRGYWWLPENPDKKVGGVATFTPNNWVKLHIFSELEIGVKDFRPEIILGVTTTGKRVTLRYCSKNNFSFISKDVVATPVEYIAKEIFLGEHFKNSNIQFDSIEACFPLLQEWMNITGVTCSGSIINDPPKKIRSEDNFNIDYEFPESIVSEIENKLLELKIKTNIKPKRIGGAKIDENAIVKISAKVEKFSFDEGIEYIYTFQDFLRLATRKIMTPIWIKGKIEKPGDKKPKGIDIYFPLRGGVNIPKHLHPEKANFMLYDISDQFDSTMKKWYQKAEELKPLYNLYFEFFHNPNLYPRNKFLSLTQALEAYYRVEHGEKYITDDEFYDGYYEQLCDNIPNDLPSDFKSHLKDGTFKYANEFSLKNKLKKILEKYGSVFSKLPLDIKSEIDTLVNTRNYLIHYDKDIDNYDTSRIPEFTNILGLIIEVILLREIRIPKEKIIESLS